MVEKSKTSFPSQNCSESLFNKYSRIGRSPSSVDTEIRFSPIIGTTFPSFIASNSSSQFLSLILFLNSFGFIVFLSLYHLFCFSHSPTKLQFFGDYISLVGVITGGGVSELELELER